MMMMMMMMMVVVVVVVVWRCSCLTGAWVSRASDVQIYLHPHSYEQFHVTKYTCDEHICLL